MKRAMLVPLVLLSLGIAWQAKAGTITEAVEYSTISTASDSRAFTVGYEFTTSVTLDIDALGYWVDGLTNDHLVGLWTSTGTLLASTTVLSTDPVTGNFQYDAISDLILAPGTYVIGGGYLGNNDPFPINASGITTIPGYTYVTDEQIAGSGLNFPNSSTGGSYGANGILIVDFSVNSGSAVPEPAPMILTAAGLLGFGLWRKLQTRG